MLVPVYLIPVNNIVGGDIRVIKSVVRVHEPEVEFRLSALAADGYIIVRISRDILVASAGHAVFGVDENFRQLLLALRVVVVVAHDGSKRYPALDGGRDKPLQLPHNRLHVRVAARYRAYVAHVYRKIGLQGFECGFVEFQRVRTLRLALL